MTVHTAPNEEKRKSKAVECGVWWWQTHPIPSIITRGATSRLSCFSWRRLACWSDVKNFGTVYKYQNLQKSTVSSFPLLHTNKLKNQKLLSNHSDSFIFPMSSSQSLSGQLSRTFKIERGSSLASVFQTGLPKSTGQTTSMPNFSRTFSYVLSCSSPSVNPPDSSISQVKRKRSISSSVYEEGEDFGFEVHEEVSLKAAYSLYRVWKRVNCFVWGLLWTVRVWYRGLVSWRSQALPLLSFRQRR